MSRTTRLLTGAAIGYANQGIQLLVGLWLPRFLLQHIGREAFGSWVIVGKAIAVLALLDIGVIALFPRDLSMAIGESRTKQDLGPVHDVVRRTFRVVALQVPVVAAGALAAWLYVVHRVPELSVPVAAMLVVTVLTFPFRFATALLIGAQDFAAGGLIQFISFVLQTIVTVVCVLAGMDFLALAVGWAVGQTIVYGGSTLRAFTRHADYFRVTKQPFAWSSVLGVFKRSMWPSVGQIAHLLLYGADVIVIGMFAGTTAVAVYALTLKLTSLAEMALQMVLQLGGPAFGELHGEGDLTAFSRAWTAFAQAMLLLGGGVLAAIVAANGAFVAWWVGPDNFAGRTLTALGALVTLLRVCNLSLFFPAYFAGHERSMSIAGVCDVIVTVGGSFVLVQWMGPIGAQLASLVGVTMVSIPACLHVCAKIMKRSVWDLLRSLAPCALFVFGAGAIAVLVSGPLARFGLVGWLVGAPTVLVVYGVLGLVLALRLPLGGYLRPRLARIRILSKIIGVSCIRI